MRSFLKTSHWGSISAHGSSSTTDRRKKHIQDDSFKQKQSLLLDILNKRKNIHTITNELGQKSGQPLPILFKSLKSEVILLQQMGRQTNQRICIRIKQAFPALMALTLSLCPCEFEKEAAGTLNTQDSAFQEALLKRGFLKTSGAKMIVYHQLAKHNNNLHLKSGP